MKFLLLVGLFMAVVWLARGGRRNFPRDDAQPRPPVNAASSTEEMVACAHCGVHLPKGDALSGSAGWFCSTEHRDLHPGARSN